MRQNRTLRVYFSMTRRRMGSVNFQKYGFRMDVDEMYHDGERSERFASCCRLRPG